MRRTTSARRRWGIDYDYIIIPPGEGAGAYSPLPRRVGQMLGGKLED
jgi:hypothetical protein